MMGRKKFSEIEKEVEQAFAKSGCDLEAAIERELRKLERARKPDPKEIETLIQLRDALANTKR